MKKFYKSFLSVLLAVAMLFSTSAFSQMVYAAAGYEDSTQIDTAEEQSVNAEVFFVHAATGKYITMSNVENDPILCEEKYETPSDLKTSGLFKTYYGTYKDAEVVNFATTERNTIWKTDSVVNGHNDYADLIYQYKANESQITNPTGWESITLKHNNDGTISFISNVDGNKAITVATKEVAPGVTKTGLSVSDKYTVKSNLTNNEKFYVYTKTTPKKARQVKLTNVAGTSVDINWTAPSKQIYSSFEVYYATSENGSYQLAGTTGETHFTVKNLKAKTTYYFKIRTITNNKAEGNYSPYSESEKVFTTTLTEAMPAKVEITNVTGDEKSQTITWKPATDAREYNIFRAKSRYGQYELIGTTSGNDATSFVDNAPNKSSKYENYYKVQGVNGSLSGQISDVDSLEIQKFGKNMYVFNENDDIEQVSGVVEEIFERQHYSQFGTDRYTLAFKPGDYTNIEAGSFNMGYYTQMIGLGKTPYDVQIKNVTTPPALSMGDNVTCNFWVNIENLTIKKTEEVDGIFGNSFKWAVSQAAPARRLNIERPTFCQWGYNKPDWASGGYIADTKFHDVVGSYTQQQYYYRNCEFSDTTFDGLTSIFGVNWNQLIQGSIVHEPTQLKDNSQNPFDIGVNLLEKNGYSNWANNGCTTVLDKTDETREKPFLYFDTDIDEYKVFVPSVRKNTKGISWSETSMGTGVSLSLDSFYVANPEKDDADSMNEALGKGYNLILQPGIYELDKPIEVTHENTIVLGLGMATLTSTADNHDTFIRVAGKKWNADYSKILGNYDIGGVEIAGVILDAGEKTNTLLEVGYEGANVDHSANPCVLQDVICRVGGTGKPAKTGQCIVVNSNNTIIDQTWIWRADHGDYVGWYDNTADNGLVVNGDYVSCYGLFVEHFQKYDVIWRGEYGKTYFLQNEKCYDPQDQKEWMSHGGTVKGYASYKVTNNVKNHYALGLGIYDVFINTNNAEIFLDNAIEVPNSPGVMLENACIVEIANGEGPKVGINHIINGVGCGITTGKDSATVSGKQGGYALQRMLYYRNGVCASLPDDYDYDIDVSKGINTYPVDPNTGFIKADDVEDVPQTSYDDFADKEIVKEPSSVDNSKQLGTDATDDNYFKDKIEKCTDEWNKIQSNYNGNEIKPPVKPSVEKEVKAKYGVYVGLQYQVGAFKYQVTSVNTSTWGTSKLIGVVSTKKSMKAATIPATAAFNNRPYTLKVTAVGNKAFKGLKKLYKVKIGANVKTIGTSAFQNCKKLRTISLAKVTKIGARAFQSCKALKTIKLAKVTKIGANAFRNCTKLKKIKLARVVTIGTRAFYGCKSVKTLTITSRVKTIGKSAFEKCTKLKTLTIGKKVKKIYAKAFAKDNNISKITFKGKALKTVKKNAFSKTVIKKIKSKKTKLKGNKKSIKVFKKKLKIK